MAEDTTAATTDQHPPATGPVVPASTEPQQPPSVLAAPVPPATVVPPAPAPEMPPGPPARPVAPAVESDKPTLVPARPEPVQPHAPVHPWLAAETPNPDDKPSVPAPPPPEPVKENKKRWYVVKVQSGREDTIKEAIERRVHKEGLEEFYGQIVIPVEKVTEVKTDKNGKRVTRTKERKLYPGYLMCEVEYNDRILYLFRETSGVGDFVGAQPGNPDRPPTPMSEREIQRMMGPAKGTDEPTVAPPPKDLSVGDRVKVVDGTFNGMEGSVKQILEKVAKVQVELTIFGRPVTVELEYYQVEQA
jgi:transcriptional antiterminator NusG